MPNEKMTLGRIVHIRHGEECRPCLVVKVWSETVFNGVEFLDGSNDLMVPVSSNGELLRWVTSVPKGDQDHQWHWPQECEA